MEKTTISFEGVTFMVVLKGCGHYLLFERPNYSTTGVKVSLYRQYGPLIQSVNIELDSGLSPCSRIEFPENSNKYVSLSDGQAILCQVINGCTVAVYYNGMTGGPHLGIHSITVEIP